MSFYGLLSFCAIYALAVASPGPAVAAVLARSLGHGMRGAPAFIAGLAVGDLTWFGIAAAGLAALAQVAQTAFVVIKYAGAAYLLYLAYRLWTAPAQPLETSDIESSARSHFRLFLGSLALTLGNPKTMLFFVALLPSVVSLETFTPTAYLQVSIVIVIILPLVMLAYALLATQARQLVRQPRSIRLLNRGAGTAMAGAAVAIAARGT
jgi:threonine/homoserine/homoserine lactone efflux protein